MGDHASLLDSLYSLYKHGVRKLTDADPMVLAQIYEEVRGDAG